MNQERLYKVIVGPHISEKAAIISELSNQYVFKVAVDATKLEVKKAVEKLFNVNVSDVSTLNVKGKTKRTRYGVSRRNNWKKAYVRLAQGQEIDFAVAE
ncbi:50S ribosomal protein L23 [Halieaceae bacterium]|jgi:large subunit ribosomal protein L23|nr:50S ribosomal protein L23 [Halieaceae bacterium]